MRDRELKAQIMQYRHCMQQGQCCSMILLISTLKAWPMLSVNNLLRTANRLWQPKHMLLVKLRTTGPLSTAPIMGGDALYELGGYNSSLHAAASRLNFTSFAYPDEWQFLCNQGQSFACSTPSFFDNYKTYYDPKNQHSPGAYGFQRADGDTILSYDATVAMLTAANNALTGAKTTITTHDMLLGIQAINRTNALQGVSGQIAFGSDSNPINKSLVILRVVNGGFFTLVSVQPCFPKGQC